MEKDGDEEIQMHDGRDTQPGWRMRLEASGEAGHRPEAAGPKAHLPRRVTLRKAPLCPCEAFSGPQ